MSRNYIFPDSLYKRLRFMDDGCIEFIGATNGRGYGQVRINGKTVYAHRLAYESEVGPIPEGLTLDHLCRNSLCVNVDHLEAVTQRVNVLRGESLIAKYARRTHCSQGHEYAGDNLYIHPTGARVCRTCQHLYYRQRIQKAGKSE